MPKKEINWTASADDMRLIMAIVKRAIVDGLITPKSTMDLEMDITATHLNGTPLRLADLLVADRFNFVHDVGGIRRHLNRETGKLDGRFLPRYTRRQGECGPMIAEHDETLPNAIFDEQGFVRGNCS